MTGAFCFLCTMYYENMNHTEKWLLTAAKVTVFTPPAILLVVFGIIARLWWFAFNEAFAAGATEIILAVILYVPPLIGLTTLLVSLFLWLKAGIKELSSQLLYSMIYSVAAIVSPVWLFVLWLFVTGFNR
jgi:hypothetical protein